MNGILWLNQLFQVRQKKDEAGKTNKGPIIPSSGISDFTQEIGKVEIGSIHIYGELIIGPRLCWIF